MRASLVIAAPIVILLLAALIQPAFSQDAPGPASSLPPLLSHDREIHLAESAGPPGVARGAAIYVLERGKGFVVTRTGNNGFSCLVERDSSGTLEPECFDPEGSVTILPSVLDASKLREQGVPQTEVDKSISEGFKSGQYRAPRRPGLTYMLSKENRVFNGQKVVPYPPHVMFFAPYLKNSDIGADMKDPRMPWVLGEGTPHAYMIMVVRDEPPAEFHGSAH